MIELVVFLGAFVVFFAGGYALFTGWRPEIRRARQIVKAESSPPLPGIIRFKDIFGEDLGQAARSWESLFADMGGELPPGARHAKPEPPKSVWGLAGSNIRFSETYVQSPDRSWHKLNEWREAFAMTSELREPHDWDAALNRLDKAA